MNLMTLKGLEAIAERKFEEQVYKWGRIIEDREGVGFDELKPYLVSLYYAPKCRLEAVFCHSQTYSYQTTFLLHVHRRG